MVVRGAPVDLEQPALPLLEDLDRKTRARICDADPVTQPSSEWHALNVDRKDMSCKCMPTVVAELAAARCEELEPRGNVRGRSPDGQEQTHVADEEEEEEGKGHVKLSTWKLSTLQPLEEKAGEHAVGYSNVLGHETSDGNHSAGETWCLVLAGRG